MQTYDKDFLLSIGLSSDTPLAYWYLIEEWDKDIAYWMGIRSGSRSYKGTLPLEEVVSLLNKETKRVLNECLLQEGEPLVEGIRRVRGLSGMSLTEASDLLKGNAVGKALIIKGGPLNNQCYVPDAYKYLPLDITEVLPLEVSTLECPNEDMWEVCIEYLDDHHQVTHTYLSGVSNPMWSITSWGDTFHLVRKTLPGSGRVVLKAPLEQCNSMEELLKEAYKEGQSNIKDRISIAISEVID